MKNLLGVLMLNLLSFSTIHAQIKTDLEIEGLKGPVKSVRFERAEILQGDNVERARWLVSVTTYDEKGNRLEELKYNANGALLKKMVFTRDDKGNQMKIIYKADGTIDSKWIYNYDSRGKMTNGTWYDPDGTLRLKIVKTYDANGKLIEDAMYNADGSTKYKTIFTYDAKGNRVSDTAYSDTGAVANKSVWSKSGGDVTLYNNDGTIWYRASSQAPTLEYDPYGNWTKWSTPKKETRGSKAEEIIEVLYRTYSYY